MGRSYKRKLGSRIYGNFTEEQINQALHDVLENGLSLRKAAKKHRVSYGTLNNKYHGRRIKKTGGQSVFTYEEEVAIINSVLTCADWGYPLSAMDLRMFVKSFLDKSGRSVSKFKQNIPGIDWVNSLLKRHRGVAGKRLASNIKKSRAEVSTDLIKKYFDNLEQTLENVPAENIFNYDESNVSDDPGKKLCIYRRGTKYPEKVCNRSKSATSIMVCGSASGTLLPPYVIYKSENLWDTWTENGSPCCEQPYCSLGTRYNRTSHGWIDMSTFNDWFVTCFLPHAKRLEGKKVLLGDNLASHFNPDVLRQCEKNNIIFACLPCNSTHICQPLDVAFFRPLKESWRKTITTWKMQNSKTNGIPKNEFPKLLKQSLESMDKVPPKTPDGEKSAIKRNLLSGFEACGIAPFNPNRVLEKLPQDAINEDELRSSLTDFLKDLRYNSGSEKSRRKKKLLAAEPGQSISAPKPFEEYSDDDGNEHLKLDKSDNDVDLGKDEEEVEYFSPTLENITEGKFLLVRFLSGSRKKTEFRYVCMVKEVLEKEEIEVQGLKSAGSRKIFKILENDISTVPFKDVVALLPDPTLEKISDRIQKYHFHGEINIKEC